MIEKFPYMEHALNEAQTAQGFGEVPVGAVVVGPDGALLAVGHNRVVMDKDPTAHAEMNAIRWAANVMGSERLTGCDLYVTLEPCAMCAQAIAFARIRRVYFGAYDEKGGGVTVGARIFDQATTHHAPEVYGGIMERECSEILKDFFKSKR